MKKTLAAAVALTALFAVPALEAEMTGPDAFEQIKELAGSWSGRGGMLGAEDTWQEMHYELKLSAGGTVVMETMNPGTEFEMINVYHLDGSDLVLTHYCSGGNQPKMRLDLSQATSSLLPFDFDGGTNLEDADHHIHSSQMLLHEDGTFESRWTSVSGGEKLGEMHAHLQRSE